MMILKLLYLKIKKEIETLFFPSDLEEIDFEL
jgi:hypothetical protein